MARARRTPPIPPGAEAVIRRLETRGPVTYLNPGSAGPRRFSLPISLARMSVVNGRIDARLLRLD